MKIIFIGFSITIIFVQVITESCQESRELESSCGSYCFKVVRPLLDRTKLLQSQVDEFGNSNKPIDKLEMLKHLIDEKLNLQNRNFEQKLNDLRNSNENSMRIQFAGLDKKLEDMRKTMEVKKSTVGKPFQKLGSKYYYIEQSHALNWFEAAHKCVTLGGHLVSIKNQAEFNAIVTKLQQHRSYWIDINDLGAEGQFFSLTTGLRATYYNWHGNNPDNYRQNEHCGDLWYHDNKHLMNDNNCHNKSFFICEPDGQ